MISLSRPGAAVEINPQGGHLDRVSFEAGGRQLSPMHRAQWRTGENNGGVPETLGNDIAPTLRSLAGDFFCAPFAEDDLTGGPEHGPPANGVWREISRDEGRDRSSVTLELDGTLLGATLSNTVTVRAGHPVIYQRHRFAGGEGAISLAHHPMVRTDGGVRVSFSPKRFGATPDHAIETDPARGRCLLRYPQRFADLSRVERADGGFIDLRSLPGPEGYEDFLLMAEAADSRLGWSVVLAPAQGFLFFIIRDPKVLPSTMLWLSNGGRNHPPFNGRHSGVLGIEEGCTFFNAGYRTSIADNALNREGIPTAVPLRRDRPTEISLAFGAIPAPAGWSEIATVWLTPDAVHFRDVSGAETAASFDPELAGVAP